MKTAFRWTLLFALCAILLPGALSAQFRDDDDFGPRQLERGTVIFDGVEFAPGELELPNRALTWVLTKEDAENGTIHVFTSREVAGKFMNRLLDKDFGKDRGKGLKLTTANACSYTSTLSAFNK